MNRTYTILTVFIATYGAILVFPLAYLLSPLMTPETHTLLLVLVFCLTLPSYTLGFKHFGVTLPLDAVKYGILYSQRIQRFFLGFVLFFIFGVTNGVIITTVTEMNAIPFAVKNPTLEGSLLIVTLFALIVQSATIQYLKETVSSVPEFEELTE